MFSLMGSQQLALLSIQNLLLLGGQLRLYLTVLDSAAQCPLELFHHLRVDQRAQVTGIATRVK